MSRLQTIVAPEPELVGRFVSEFAARAGEASKRRGRFALAVPGGSVATRFLPALAAAPVAWDRVDLFWADERAVPPEDPESNFAAARAWLDHAGLDPLHVHRMPGDAKDLETAARRYAAILVEENGDPPRLDLAILGVGPDGHVASLFPGHPVLDAETWVAAVTDSPKPPPHRLTLTLRTFGAAREIWIVALGASKSK